MYKKYKYNLSSVIKRGRAVKYIEKPPGKRPDKILIGRKRWQVAFSEIRNL